MYTNKSVPAVPSLKKFPIGFERIEETFDYGRDLVCFSHLRWDFVYQRPQHLMSRFARECRVFYVEEPLWGNHSPQLSMRIDKSGVCVVVPLLPEEMRSRSALSVQRRLLEAMFSDCGIRDCITWYYTPMARAFTNQLKCRVIVYDCMDELALFKNAPHELKQHESELLRVADVVFTGGVGLYEAKKSRHRNIHAMPSGIDIDHFKTARSILNEPEDQRSIPHPRLGFAGVIDERMDIELISAISEVHPEWHFVFIGPVVKIDPGSLPQHPNIHYFGQKPYAELPAYMSGWDVALMPFALNDATRYISPTKTPEYLAAGKPVVSTSIRDVVATYEARGLVRIADDPEEFSSAIQAALNDTADVARFQQWQAQAEAFLANMTWDRTWMAMLDLVESAISTRDGNRCANAG
jgi:UDP-galactopyranose mutase